ncbi:ABC transporter ATP-binding protein [Streptococcus cuniculipharyngis]|uniref:ABC transporter ATP-binding protein n=1 Tax=Streptococcus cuniculipharyngis TaxID=1562651 RepID=A0A5C5SBV6_9STRE|nr:ABC transporter ATP-binding protein [Streptococcus cuniculipharyngis]
MENHRITGSGIHQEFLKTHEIYARFVKEQIL